MKTDSGYLVVALEVRLLLQAVHEVLKHLLRDGRHSVTPPLVVHDVKPDVILLVNVVLHLLIQLLHGLVDVPEHRCWEEKMPQNKSVYTHKGGKRAFSKIINAVQSTH